MYSIQELITTFQKHHEKSVAMNKELIEKHKEFWPDEPLPPHFTDEFSMPLALKAICEAIQNLQTKTQD